MWSVNWGGYDTESSTACTSFTSVTGQWVQPALACPGHDEGTLETDFWVGLDGAGSATAKGPAELGVVDGLVAAVFTVAVTNGSPPSGSGCPCGAVRLRCWAMNTREA